MRDSVHHGEVDINYIFRKSTNESDVLVVSFPGVGLVDFTASLTGYTYIVTIKSFDVNALFIKSRSGSESYVRSRMTCVNRDFKIERSVHDLITACAEKSGSKRIIVVGSSMGGYSSLYYGLKYGYDVISGAGVIDFADDATVMYTAGGTTEEDRRFANSLLPAVIKSAGERGYDKRLFLCWGSGESYWTDPNHAPKLLADLDAAKIKYNYELLPYGTHSTVHKLFPSTLKEKLAEYLGLETGRDGNGRKDNQRDEAVLHQHLKDAYAGLLPQVGALAGTELRYGIARRARYGNTDKDNAFRYFVYGMQGCFLYIDPKKPQNCIVGDASDFWAKFPPKKLDDALSFLYQQIVLNHYENSGDIKAFKHVEEHVHHFFKGAKGLVKAVRSRGGKYLDWWCAARRMHFLLNFAHARREIGGTDTFSLESKIREEVVECLRNLCVAEVLPRDAQSNYWRVLALLHAVKFYAGNSEFYGNAYDTALAVAVLLTDYYFNDDGLCLAGQAGLQRALGEALDNIVEFVKANGFPETANFRKLSRVNEKILAVSSHFLRPDNFVPALGQSDPAARGAIGRIGGNLILPKSNIAILNDEDDLAYITVNSGQNTHASLKHSDLLSFTFWYDGAPLVQDSGAGAGALAEFAGSSVAHSALLCDEADYITPNYVDWTTFESAHSVIEGDNHILLSMNSRIFNGVTLTRKLLWIKPNVILLYDTAASAAEHLYTQNYILGDASVDAKNGGKVKVAQKTVKLDITQIPVTGASFELKHHRGTTNVNAEPEIMRGSIIRGGKKLAKGNNLAYNQTGKTAKFLTVLEAHGGSEKAKAAEVGVDKATLAENTLTVDLNNGTSITLDLGA